MDGIDNDVVNVLMRDQDTIGALERIWGRKRARIDHQCLAGLFESYARVAELTEAHASSSIPHVIYDEMHHLGQIDPTARACASPAIHIAG